MIADLTDLAQNLTSKWWTFLLRGLFALALAIFALSLANRGRPPAVWFIS